jgi:NAD(P)-dependent dehydrogenase (short-subunit alcohol dehydrogenase family)
MSVAIVGAGPGVGAALARAFGRDGRPVGLVARDRQRLEQLAEGLRHEGIVARAFPADVRDRPGLTQALDEIDASLGPVEVMEYGPMPDMSSVRAATDVTPENLMDFMEFAVLGAVGAVQAVLPGMMSRGNGGLLFTTGFSAIGPMPRLGNLGIAMGALRTWVHSLYVQLAPSGVYAGSVCIGARVEPGGEGDPDHIAGVYLDMYAKRDRFEELVPPDRMTRPG